MLEEQRQEGKTSKQHDQSQPAIGQKGWSRNEQMKDQHRYREDCERGKRGQERLQRPVDQRSVLALQSLA